MLASQIASVVLATAAPAGSEVGALSGLADLMRSALQRLDILNHPDQLLDTLSQLPFFTGAVIAVVGLLCVLNGYRWHKWVIVALSFLCGLGLGKIAADRLGESTVVAVALGLLCAILANPLLKVTVAIFAGATGAFIGSNIWGFINSVPPDLHWAGALIGFIVLGMTSLMLFRFVIVLFTSVGGAAMMVFGGITLLLHVPSWEPALRDSLMTNDALLPLLVMLAAVTGFVIQESRNKVDAAEAE